MAAWTAAVAVALLAAAPAMATDRFAAPGASLLNDCSSPASACPLTKALPLTGALDTLTLAPGIYDVASGQTLTSGTLQGTPGQPRPLIQGATGATPLLSIGVTSTVRNIALTETSDNAVALQSLAQSTIDHVVITSTGAGGTGAVLGTSALMSDSTVFASGNPGTAISVPALGAPTIRNVTAYGLGAGGSGIAAANGATVTAVNTIARAPQADGVSGSDVRSTGSLATFLMTNSNFSSQTGTINFTGSTGNQGAPPLLVNPTAGDFHELPGSPTINAGSLVSLPGETDLDGTPRALDGIPDIGAFERAAQPPVVSVGSPIGISSSAATLVGSVNPNGLPTTYHFEYGLTPLYGSSTPAQSAGAGTTAVPITTALASLPAGSIIHYRLVATNADGTRSSLDQILILLAPTGLGGGSGSSSSSGPRFTGVSYTQTPAVGQPTTFTVKGSDPKRAVTGIVIDFGEAGHLFAESACRLKPGANKGVFAPNRQNTFRVPYAFATPGLHLVQITLTSGCGKLRKTSTQTIQVSPVAAPAAKRGAGAVTAAKKRGCGAVNARPGAANANQLAAATICLLNQQRARNHLGPLRANKKLTQAASYQAHAMISGRFFAHQGPGELGLAGRFRLFKYRGGGGENIGMGVGLPFETPASMVAAWMASPVHRANILCRSFHTIGQVVVAQRPGLPPVPGATYVTEFGTTRR